MKLNKRNCDMRIRLTPYDYDFLRVHWRIDGENYYFLASGVAELILLRSMTVRIYLLVSFLAVIKVVVLPNLPVEILKPMPNRPNES